MRQINAFSENLGPARLLFAHDETDEHHSVEIEIGDLALEYQGLLGVFPAEVGTGRLDILKSWATMVVTP
jgi:hypothetical protein